MSLPRNPPVAVLDANVLFSMVLCDTLMRAALKGMYHAHWNETILDEVERNLVAQQRATHDGARRRRSNMQRTLPYATVIGYEPLLTMMTNDPKDRHVLATALLSGSAIIVTHNRRHFPTYALAPYGIEVQSPDVFLQTLLRQDPHTMIRVLIEQAAALQDPPLTVDQVLDYLAVEAPSFTDTIRPLIRHTNDVRGESNRE